MKLWFTVHIFFRTVVFYGNYLTLDSHTNAVISYPFAYWSRWHWELWQGLLFSPCKWGRDSNSPLFSNRENNGLQSVCSLHYVLSSILYLIILMQVTFIQFYGEFLDIYTKSIYRYALLCCSIVWSLLCYCLRARVHCCVLCDVTRHLLFTWYMVHQPFYVSDTLTFISVNIIMFKKNTAVVPCLCTFALIGCVNDPWGSIQALFIIYTAGEGAGDTFWRGKIILTKRQMIKSYTTGAKRYWMV